MEFYDLIEERGKGEIPDPAPGRFKVPVQELFELVVDGKLLFFAAFLAGTEVKTVFRKDNSLRPSGSRRSRSGRKCKQAWQAGRDRGGQYE